MFLTLLIAGRTQPNHNVVVDSNFTTDWKRLAPDAEMVQYKVWTDRFIGAREFNPNSDMRIEVVRLKMDFWRRLEDIGSEKDVIAGSPLGQMHKDFELYGSPEYWRDVYAFGALGIDMEEGQPEFFVESIDGILLHWTISVGVILEPSN